MYESLKGKRVLVTGAGTGIGRGVALGFAKAGAHVAVHYSSSETGARETVELIEQQVPGAVVRTFRADFREVEPVENLAAEVTAFLGGVDVLVNNAAVTMNKPFGTVDAELFDTVYHVNVRAPFLLTQALLPELEKSRGVVVNIGSIHAFEGFQEHSVYAGTRGAIVSFTRELAVELAPRGIRVNSVAPGSTVVERQYRIPGFDPESAGREIPCGFMALPEDIANVVLFLAAPESRYIVGQTIIADGGTTAWMPFGEGFRNPPSFSFGTDCVKKN